MATIIITTDFSGSAENALEYACSFSSLINNAELLLLNIYAVPSSYSADGVSLTAINDSMESSKEKLRKELDWVKENHPQLKIKSKEITGKFLEKLQQQIEEENALMVIMGTPGAYGDIRLWDTDILSALIYSSVPVLTVPQNVDYKKIANIAFVCIFENLHQYTPFASIQKMIDYTGAKLHVVNVVSADSKKEVAAEGEILLREKLKNINTDFNTINEPHVVAAIGRFVTEHHIDLLLVRPRKHGIWYNLFHKSYSKELAKLNMIPVMALHESETAFN